MDLRRFKRTLRRILIALTIPDHLPALPAGPTVILSCQDVDRAMKGGAGHYSPILEGIRATLEECGYASINLTHPYASLRSSRVKGGVVTINYRKLFYTCCGMFASLVLRKNVKRDFVVRIYDRLVRRVKPVAVFAIEPPPELCLAARKHAIPIIEPMHAKSISRSDRIVREYFARADELSPDVYLTFDRISQDSLVELLKGRRKFSVQFPDAWLSLITRNRQASPALPEPSARSGKKILVTLQWGYDGERSCFDNIIGNGILAPELEAVLTSPGEDPVEFLIRLHPIQLNGAGYEHHRHHVVSLCARHGHLEYRHASSEPLPFLLEEVCGHITMCSGSTSEAVIAGVPTLLLCPTLLKGAANHGLFRELEPSGLVTFGKLSSEYIRAWIGSLDGLGRRPAKKQAVEFDFENELRLYRRLLDDPRSFIAAAETAAATAPATPVMGASLEGAIK